MSIIKAYDWTRPAPAVTPDDLRARARETMLPWNTTEEAAWRARLGLFDAANEIERLNKLLDDNGVER